MGCKKICKIFASELRYKSGVMRGFQKGITLGGYDFSVTPVQTGSQELGVRSFKFRIRSLELVWTSSGLSLDNFCWDFIDIT